MCTSHEGIPFYSQVIRTSATLRSLFEGYFTLKTTSKWWKGLTREKLDKAFLSFPSGLFFFSMLVVFVVVLLRHNRSSLVCFIQLSVCDHYTSTSFQRHKHKIQYYSFSVLFGHLGPLLIAVLVWMAAVVQVDQVDRYVWDYASMSSIIHPVPCLLHVVLINSLGAETVMACALLVSRVLQCKTKRFTENGFDRSVFHWLAQNVFS